MTLTLQPVTYGEAVRFVRQHHRHHGEPNRRAHRFSIAVAGGGQIVGVVMTGRPVARLADDGWTLEVSRCCTDGTPNAPSKLYAAAWRAARAMGYRRLISYTLAEEPGSSLRAAGFRVVYQTRPDNTWDRPPARPRVARGGPHQRTLWELTA